MFPFGRKKIEDTKEMKEYGKCFDCIVYFAEHYFHLDTVDHGLINPCLYDFQKRVLNEFSNTEFSRDSILLAGRQSTTTTLVAIYILHYVIFRENKTVISLLKSSIHNDYLRRIIQQAYNELPEWLQHGLKSSRDRMTFGNGTAILFKNSHRYLRGQGISLLYKDEHEDPHSAEEDEFFKSVMPTLWSSNTAEVIFSSYKSSQIYRDALAGNNSFKPIKINWWEVPGRGEAWKHDMIKHIGHNHFNKEFECLTTTQT